MESDILKQVLSGDVTLDILFKWLKNNELPHADLLQLSFQNYDRSDFSRTFLNDLRSSTKWLFKKREDSKTCENDEATKDIPKTPDVNFGKTPAFESSPSCDQLERNEKSVSSQKGRRLKLAMSPIVNADESRIRFSTPRSNVAFSPITPPTRFSRTDSLNSSFGESPVFPSPPLQRRPRNRNRNSESNKSLVEDTTKSKTKLSLGDFMVNSRTKNNKGRRIKPTRVSPEKNETDNVFMNASEVGSTKDDERMIMRKECESLQQQFASTSLLSSSPLNSTASTARSMSETPPSMGSPVTCENTSTDLEKTFNPFSPELTTSLNILEILAKIYSFILKENLCENIMVELHFLLTILTKTDCGSGSHSGAPFDTVQNCVHFAVLTLVSLQDVISLLSPVLLNLIAGYPAVAIFSPKLQMELEAVSRKKISLINGVLDINRESNVSFQCDTDNIENFTSHINFTAFRKQRDELYKLLQKWEGNQKISNWATKVKAIILIKEDPTNLMHLARLFRNQLLASCSSQCQGLDEAGSEVLQLLPSTDRAKLSRLEARLTGPAFRGGPVPAPDFPGKEFFYSSFIEACGHGPFIHFLQLAFVDELLRLNDGDFFSEGNDGFADELTQKRYLECLTSTRLLAKFLAFAEFLPYDKNKDIPEQVLLLHSQLRQRVLPLFDAEQCLREALRSHKLVLTVPWLASYLAMMDRVSSSLEIYKNVWAILGGLQRNIPSHVSLAGRLLLQLTLGWLFQVSTPPDILPLNIDFATEEKGLDELDVVSETSLYSACPFLMKLNDVLAGNAGSSNPRHIRPTPQLDQLKDQKTLAVKQLELRLEENFLQNQTPSTRRGIQFVIERVASCCIKSLASDVIPRVRTQICDAIKKELDNITVTNQQKATLDSGFAQWESKVRAACSSSIWSICSPRAQLALRCILGRDVCEASTQVACELATRQAMEKVESWMLTQVYSDSGRREARKEMESVLFPKSEGKSKECDTSLGEEPIVYLSTAMICLQTTSWNALLGVLTNEELMNCIQITNEAIASKSFPQAVERSILCLVIDLLLFIFLRCPFLKPTGIQLTELISKLHLEEHSDTPLDRVISQRNLEMICSQDDCNNLTACVVLFLRLRFLSEQDIRDQIQNCERELLPETLRARLSAITVQIYKGLFDNRQDC